MITASCAVKAGAGYAETRRPGAGNQSSDRYSPSVSMRHGEKRIAMKKIPVIDIGKCTDCESCLAICPEVFRKNKETGLIEVEDLPDYPEELVDQVISMCPTDCISWEEI